MSSVGSAITASHVGEGDRVPMAVMAGEVGDRPAQHGVLDGGEVTVQHRREQGGDHGGLAAGELVGAVVGAYRSGVERVEPVHGRRGAARSPRARAASAKREVFAFGVGDGDPASEHADRCGG